MADVTFRRGVEENLPTSGMAEDGCIYQSTDTGNVYIGGENGELIPVNRSPYYGTCATTSSTNAKVVTLNVDDDNFVLVAGTTINVRFTNGNTSLSPTLNVNGTGAVAVKEYGTTAVGNTDGSSWRSGEVVLFVYDGTYWMRVGKSCDLSEYLRRGTLIDTVAIGSVVPPAQHAVLYDAQTLGSSQKAQARSNIGAGTSSFSGSYADLANKPSINSVTLSGNKTASDLGLATSAQGAKADTALQPTDDVAYVGDVVNSASTVGFDPQSDTVWNKQQTLSSAQKAQARTNISAQETLVSGTNIKTINNQSLLGSGNITIQGGGGGGASALSELSDVSVSSPSNGQGLIYNGTTEKWENATLPSGGSATWYIAEWTATTTSSSGTVLTDTLNLPSGMYIVRTQIPVTSAIMTLQLDGTNISQRSNTYRQGTNYAIFIDFVEVLSGGGTLKVISASNATQNLTYLERGSLQALKIS